MRRVIVAGGCRAARPAAPDHRSAHAIASDRCHGHSRREVTARDEQPAPGSIRRRLRRTVQPRCDLDAPRLHGPRQCPVPAPWPSATVDRTCAEAPVEAAVDPAAGRRVRPAGRSRRIFRARVIRRIRARQVGQVQLGAPPVPEFLRGRLRSPGWWRRQPRPPPGPRPRARQRSTAGVDPWRDPGAGARLGPPALAAPDEEQAEPVARRAVHSAAGPVRAPAAAVGGHRPAGRRPAGRRHRRGHRCVRREPAAGGRHRSAILNWPRWRRRSPASRDRSRTSRPGCCRRWCPWRSAPATSGRPVPASSSTATATS